MRKAAPRCAPCQPQMPESTRMKRRILLKALAMSPLAYVLNAHAAQARPFDFQKVRTGMLDRLAGIARAGVLPIIDIESSVNPVRIDLRAFMRAMDQSGIAQMCLSVDQPGDLVKQGVSWSHAALEFAADFPDYFIPVGNGANEPAWTQSPDRFLNDNERYIIEYRYPMMGEFEFRHYPSPRQIERGQWNRDVDIPIDSPQGQRLFAFAERSGIPLQIHYEIEDRLLAPLEAMLTRYPRAKVIWCHLAQIRYSARATQYGPQLLESWLKRFPNLYIDTAFGPPQSVYKPSAERHARYWTQSAQWKPLIEAHPYRFLAALDIGGDRMDRVNEWSATLRAFLDTLPPKTAEIVAYKSAWKLLFGEEL